MIEMMNVPKFSLEVINKSGLKYEVDATVNAVAYKGRKIVSKGYLSDFTGRQPYLSELKDMIRLAEKYNILLILDRNRDYIDLNREFKEVTVAFFIDLAAYQEILADMTKEVGRLEESEEYLQENETLLSLIKRYQESVNGFREIISMAREEAKVDEVLSEMKYCLDVLNRSGAEFLINGEERVKSLGKEIVDNTYKILKILSGLVMK